LQPFENFGWEFAMKIIFCLAVALLIAITGGLTRPESTWIEDDPELIGWITPIKGPAYVIPRGQTTRITHNGPQDRRGLHGGDRVGCEANGSYELFINNQVIPRSWSRSPYPIPMIAPPTDPQTRQALQAYGHLGGRTRPGPQDILSPSAENNVSPELLVFRWVKRPGLIFLSVTTQRGGQIIWEANSINGQAGELVSAEARNRMREYRRDGGTEGLVLTLGGGGRIARANFTLLTEDADTALQTELRQWSQTQNSLLKHVGRAETFSRNKMFAEEAQEYEDALRENSSSIFLKIKVRDAQRALGNTRRVTELERLIPRETLRALNSGPNPQ
jgi:hypothetical protein